LFSGRHILKVYRTSLTMSRYETLFLICNFEMVIGAEDERFERGRFAETSQSLNSRHNPNTDTFTLILDNFFEN
jgi:hypothetical protein